MTDTQTPKKSAGKNSEGFSAEERAAMRERAKELKVAKDKEAAEADVLAKIAEMPEPDRSMAERLHALVNETAPQLASRTWYGMPAYTLDGNVICFFKVASKFGARYATLGFSDQAKLDDGAMWPTDYAVTEMTPEVESRIAELVKRAVS
jgi:uncharacterized protein YdhG (YjbR/CyaY superfamily)